MWSRNNSYAGEVSHIRAVDLDIKPGVTSDEGGGDAWPSVRGRLLDADILIMASPTWLGRPSSVAQRVLERVDAMISETDDEGRPVAYNRVAGVVVTGNEDGAHHVISEIAGALGDVGYTVPGQRGPTGTAWARRSWEPTECTPLPADRPLRKGSAQCRKTT